MSVSNFIQKVVVRHLFVKQNNITNVVFRWKVADIEIWRQISRLGIVADIEIWRQISRIGKSREIVHEYCLWCPFWAMGWSRRHEIWRQISRLVKKVADMKFDVKFRDFGEKLWNFPWNLTSIFRSCVSLQGHHTYAHKVYAQRSHAHTTRAWRSDVTLWGSWITPRYWPRAPPYLSRCSTLTLRAMMGVHARARNISSDIWMAEVRAARSSVTFVVVLH